MSEEREERSFGSRQTLRSEGGGAASEGAGSIGSRETLRDGAGWGILEEWGGKRWKAGEEILGRYVVERELGQGGMGVVYECLDKVGGVKVAVKALPPELSHNSVEMEEVRENFQLVVGLRHSNIAGARTLEKDGRGEYFLVMDVAEGESLRRWMRRKLRSEESGGRSEGGGLPLADVLPILRQVAGALDYAHGERVVHRDVKPGNVMIDGRGRVKVLDFGLAAQIRTSLSRASRAYRGTSGTGPYMAPEQWEAQPQDAKTDQYALAVMAYEMLSGRLPFENSELAVLKDAVLHGEAPAIPGLPGHAMRALRKAMGKRKEERFESCGAFVEALGGEGGGRGGWGKTLVGWVAVLGLLGAGAWWGVKQTALPEGPLPQETAAAATAGEPPAPPGETRLEAASPEALAEAAVKEAERLAAAKKAREEAQQAAEEAGKKLEEAVSEEDDGAKWRAERAAVDAASTSIDILQTHARTSVAILAEYRKNPEGLSEHIGAAEAAAGELAAIQRPATGEEAKTRLDAAQTASGRLTLELEWLAQNQAARDTALRVEEDIVSSLDALLKEYEAADSAKGKYNEGMKSRKAGQDALAEGKFGEARPQLEQAKRTLAEALAEARADRAARHVESAKRYAGEGMWEKCLELAKAALVAEPGNADAEKLKAEAAGKLKPLIRLTATLDGKDVAATVTEGLARSGQTTPVTVENVESGENYAFAAEYRAGGKTYAGRTTVQAKTKGVTEAVVALAERKEAAAGEVFPLDLGGGVQLQMVHCPGVAGDFWMGKTEVTQEQWQRMMGKNPSDFAGKPKNPVENVSWNDCTNFVAKLNALPAARASGLTFRLPTAEEWKTACRAGAPKSADYCKLADGTQITEATLSRVAWFNEDWGTGSTHPVGTKDPNAWGLHDMHGNVWEWTQTADGDYRVYCGGSFNFAVGGCTAGLRNWGHPGGAFRFLGLRLAASGRAAAR